MNRKIARGPAEAGHHVRRGAPLSYVASAFRRTGIPAVVLAATLTPVLARQPAPTLPLREVAYLEDNAGQGVRPAALQPFLIVDQLNPWRDHRNQAEESGAVYVYTRNGATWTARACVKGSNTEAGDEFGSAVALGGDGRTLAVGAHNEDGTGNAVDDSGAVYVFMY
ncbi:MAG: FG-GAP repeat protein [Acidobacteria bacterium]|nr:FG-GAP repeat protein [Acidobacteriota bacterium]